MLVLPGAARPEPGPAPADPEPGTGSRLISADQPSSAPMATPPCGPADPGRRRAAGPAAAAHGGAGPGPCSAVVHELGHLLDLQAGHHPEHDGLAWPAGRVAIRASAARVEASSRTVAAGSSGPGGSARLVAGGSWTGRRAARRRQSRALCRAMVNTQARDRLQ
jgi:hypothetical protein